MGSHDFRCQFILNQTIFRFEVLLSLLLAIINSVIELNLSENGIPQNSVACHHLHIELWIRKNRLNHEENSSRGFSINGGTPKSS